MRKISLFIFLIFLSVTVFGSYTFDFDDSSLILYFDMQPKADYLTNSTVNSNKGSLAGIWNWTTVNMLDHYVTDTQGFYVNNSFGSLELRSGEYIHGGSPGLEVIESINPSSFFVNDSFTYSVWFRKNNASLTAIEDIFRFMSNLPQQSLRFSLNESLGLKFRDADGSEYDVIMIDNENHYKDYSWHHLCLSNEDLGAGGVRLNIYYDNTTIASHVLSDMDNVIPTTCNPNDVNACDIGHTDHVNLDTMNGSITEFRLYNTSLSREQCGSLHDIRLLSSNTYQYPFFTRKPFTVSTNTIQLNYTSTDSVSFSYNASEYIVVTQPVAGILQVNLTDASLSMLYAHINISNANGSDTVLLRMNATNATIPQSNSLVFYTNFQNNASLFNNVSVLNLGSGWDYTAVNFAAQDIVRSINVAGTFQGLNFSETKVQKLQVNTTFNPSTVFTNNEISVSMWLNVSSLASGDFEIPFHITDNLATVVLQKLANDTWQLQTRTTTGTEVIHTFAGVNYITGDWQHVGFTIKNNSGNSHTVTLYHNGSVVSNQTQNYTGSFFGDDCDVSDGGCGVGLFTGTGAFEYRGMLDELRVYSHAISGQEMENLANLTLLADAATPPTFNQTYQNTTQSNGTFSFVGNWSATNDALGFSNDSRWTIVTDNTTQTMSNTLNVPGFVGVLYTTWTISNGDGNDVQTTLHTFTQTNISPFFVTAPFSDNLTEDVAQSYTFTWDGTNDAHTTVNDTRVSVATYNTTKQVNVSVLFPDPGVYHVQYVLTNSDGSDTVEVLYEVAAAPVPVVQTCDGEEGTGLRVCQMIAGIGIGFSLIVGFLLDSWVELLLIGALLSLGVLIRPRFHATRRKK